MPIKFSEFLSMPIYLLDLYFHSFCALFQLSNAFIKIFHLQYSKFKKEPSLELSNKLCLFC